MEDESSEENEETRAETEEAEAAEDAPAEAPADGETKDAGTTAGAPADGQESLDEEEPSPPAEEGSATTEETEEQASGEEEDGEVHAEPESAPPAEPEPEVAATPFVADGPREKGPVDLSKIEMVLTFDLGEMKINLGELESLQDGYVFTLDRPDDDWVNIRANGRLIGRGHLIKIDDRLGVQIENLQG